MLNKNIEAASQTIGPIITKAAIVYWIVAHKTWCSGSSNCLGPNNLSGLASLDESLVTPTDNLPPPGGHWGIWGEVPGIFDTHASPPFTLVWGNTFYFLPSAFKGTSLLHCSSSNLFISSDIRGEKSRCSGLTQLPLVSPHGKPPQRRRNTCISQRAWVRKFQRFIA